MNCKWQIVILSSRSNLSWVTCFLTKSSIKFQLYIYVHVQYVHDIQERQAENYDSHILQIFVFSVMKTDTEIP